MSTVTRFQQMIFNLALLGAFVLFGTGCDNGVNAVDDDPESVTVSGQVHENSENSEQTAKVQSAGKSVSGAVVSAVAINADGTVSALEGEVTTGADGEFTLEAVGEGASDHIRVFAHGEGDFVAGSIVRVDGQNTVTTRPLTAEYHAEADVYLEAKSEDGSNSHYEGVTAADVSLFIDQDVAAEIIAGAESAADFGIAIAGAVKAQAEYDAKTDAGVDMNEIAAIKSEAYARFQSDLAAAANAEARAEAYAELEEAYTNVFVESGIDVETQAEFHQIFTSILIEASGDVSGDAELGFRKQAELISAKATALAVEAAFQAEGASESTLETLAQGRVTLEGEIKTATSLDAIVEAKEDYKAVVDAETESSFDISSEIRAAAEVEVNSAVEAYQSLLASLSIFVSDIAEATADAFADLYLDAQLDVKTSLEASGIAEAEAEAAAGIIVMTGVMMNS